MSDPKSTIKVKSCRGDGRCPECCAVAWCLVDQCGCRVCGQDCWAAHLAALLTEALRISALPWMFGERAGVLREREQLREERDAATREKATLSEDLRMALVEIDHLRDDLAAAITRGDAAIRERDSLREAQNDAYAAERERAKEWNALERERDETRQDVAYWREQHQWAIDRLKEALDQRDGARERAEKAEALLTRAQEVLDRCHYRLTEMLEAPALREDIAVLMAAICEEQL